MIRQSPLYKEAHSILSSDQKYGQQFLFDLEAIPYKYNMRDRNFWDGFIDDFGGTSSFDQQLNDLFNQAMEEIRLVMQRYNSFIAGLPVNQDQQLKDAGYNSSITGEGLTPSSLGVSDPMLSVPTSDYTSQDIDKLSSGLNGFVSFIGAVAGLTDTAVGAITSLGELGIKEGELSIDWEKLGLDKSQLGLLARADYRDQESHDLELIKQGLRSPSPYRSGLANSNQAVLSDYADEAIYLQRINKELAKSDAENLYKPVSLSSDPRLTGLDVMSRVSQLKFEFLLARQLESNIKQSLSLQYADLAGTLGQMYQIETYKSGISQAGFTQQYYDSRDPLGEGSAQSTMQQQAVALNEMQRKLYAFQDYMNNLKQYHILDWQQQIENDPSVLPFYYKAALDFDMTDVFHHQDSTHQNVFYGLQTLSSGLGLIESISRSFDNFRGDPKKKEDRNKEIEDKKLSIRDKLALLRLP